MTSVPEFVLASPVNAGTCEDVANWWPRHRALAEEWHAPIELAIASGFSADRVGWAFASGYQAALHALVPELPADRICALCVTEEAGNAPKAIRSTLRRAGDGWRLDGAKRWTTLGPDGALFLVAARDATVPGERPVLRMARVASDSAGVSIEPMPHTRFVPEVPHAELRFANVLVAGDALLPGDGYDRYVKPFRTVEDTHVHAAVLAYLVREARRLDWPKAWLERAAANLLALCAIAALEATAAATHAALAGALACGESLMAETDAWWPNSPDAAAAARWQRDRQLLLVAGRARAARIERAWQRLAV